MYTQIKHVNLHTMESCFSIIRVTSKMSREIKAKQNIRSGIKLGRTSKIKYFMMSLMYFVEKILQGYGVSEHSQVCSAPLFF